MPRCDECGREFKTNSELKAHFHAVKTVSNEPLIFLLELPDGCDPGRLEAAEAFKDAISELRGKRPDIDFQLIPFSYSDFGGLESILAIGKNK